MLEQHGKGVAGFIASATGAVIAWWPLVDATIRDLSGIAGAVSGIYAALYFREQWKARRAAK